MVEYPPRLWNRDDDKRIVHIDFLPAEVDHHYQVEVVGDLAHALWMLNERLAEERLPLPLFDLPQQWAVPREMMADTADHAGDDTPGPNLIVVPIDYRENRLLTERLGNIACPI